MWQLAVAFLIFVVLLTVLVRIGAAWIGRAAGRATRRRFEQAEHIIETGRPPEAWLGAAAKLGDHRRRGGWTGCWSSSAPRPSSPTTRRASCC